MAQSYNEYGPKGVGDTIVVGFPFESRTHVTVRVDDVLVAANKWSWLSDGLLSCLAGFPVGTATRVLRTTPSLALAGTLVGTASLDYPMVNSNFTRLLYIEQEKADAEADREARLAALETELDTQQGDLDASVLLGQRWANEAENVVVAGGEYSSKHYMEKAKDEKAAAVVAKDASVAAKDASVTAKTASETARDLSQKWAANPEDSVVSGGLFSALHYAAKAAASLDAIVNGMAGWIHSAANKVTPAGADEIGIADSTASWGLKRLSLTNLAAWLASLSQTLTNKTLVTPAITDELAVTSTAAGTLLRLTSTDAGAGAGPDIIIHRNSASPTPGDLLGVINWFGKSTTGINRTYAQMYPYIVDATNGSEDARFRLATITSGSSSVTCEWGAGMYMTGATGGDPGAGKINATELQVNGVPLAITKSYTSAEQTITIAGALTLAHGLSVKPKIMVGLLVCKTAQGGYSVGDECPIFPGTFDTYGLMGVSAVATTSNIELRYGEGNGSTCFAVPHKSTGALFGITPANWRLVVRAFA